MKNDYYDIKANVKFEEKSFLNFSWDNKDILKNN